MVNAIIEMQKVRTFMRKLDLEWNSQVKSCVLVGFGEINIYLRYGLLPVDFASDLMPRAGMFIDFHTAVSVRILDYHCEHEMLVNLNRSL